MTTTKFPCRSVVALSSHESLGQDVARRSKTTSNIGVEVGIGVRLGSGVNVATGVGLGVTVGVSVGVGVGLAVGDWVGVGVSVGEDVAKIAEATDGPTPLVIVTNPT